MSIPGAQPPTRAQLKDLARLKTPKGREETGLQLLEGARLTGEGLAAGRVSTVFVTTDELLLEWRERAGSVPVIRLPEAEIRRIADVRTPQSVLAVGPLAESVPAAALLDSRAIVLLDGVQDPGNAGALARTACALGVEALAFSDGSADPSSPKVLRAAAGTLFRMRVGRVGASAGFIAGAAQRGHSILVPAVKGGVDHREAPRPSRYVLVAGNEGAGSSLLESPGVTRITIPMAPGVESLNVGAACAIILARLESRG